ncbi:MAG: Uncharacterized protein FD143_873 [Ignavibacteria bacterium]|nr:MAG: Uncharacterized protein FD143_873 [Ignavibacteria bacterium]KAF0161117.1 MAG: Uncharacterized protein FD188_1028 [Ignavibacteria bacterium]
MMILTVDCCINAQVEKVWKLWTEPEHICKWNFASNDWHAPYAENNLTEGGRFKFGMAAVNGSASFDFEGTYDKIVSNKLIEYTLDDKRKVSVKFASNGNETTVTETFETESTYTPEMQKFGWQCILNNFKTYVEKPAGLETLRHEVIIDAEVNKVFKTMLTDQTYREWTSVFNPTSYFDGKWEKGAKMLFLGTDADGKRGGMVSIIRDFVPNKFVDIEHVGMISGDEEITSGEAVESWAGSHEKYLFFDENGKTVLIVQLDTNEEFKSYFLQTYPKALDKLKSICETK